MPEHLTCFKCGAAFDRIPSRARRAAKNFCSQQCAKPEPSVVVTSVDGSTARVALYASGGAIEAWATVDAEDAEWVGRWRWNLHRAGAKIYAGRSQWSKGRSRLVRMHRAILGLEAGDRRQGDHINRDTLDNRRENLRIVTHAQNGHNQTPQSGKTSRHRGVSWNRGSNRWVANIRANKRMIYLGKFTSEEDAAEVARLARARMLTCATD